VHHGGRSVTRLVRRLGAPVVLLSLVALAALAVRPGPGAAAEGRTLHVPGDFPGVAEAVAASLPGDVILLAAGTYPGDVVIPETKPGITIRGVDRNTVVFDGQDIRHTAIEVEADGVALENMTAHSYVENGFYWDGVEGYAGRYLTVWNVGLYAIYAIESRAGVMEHSYVSGAADAAFYVGECYPCDAVLRNLTAVLSAVGYSGTNAGGNLVVEDSLFDRNAVGILPNSYDVALEPPPQRKATFRRNVVRDTNTVPTPRNTPLGGFAGIGIGIAGGVGNAVDANEVTGSTGYGIAVFATVDRTTNWVPSGNRVTANRVSGSGSADIALADGSGPENCFEANEAGSVLPAELASGCSADGDGHARVATELVRAPMFLLEGLPEAPHYADMPAPPPQTTMPLAADGSDLGLILALAFALVAIAGVLLLVAGQAGLARAQATGRARWLQMLRAGAVIAIGGGLATIVALALLLTGTGPGRPGGGVPSAPGSAAPGSTGSTGSPGNAGSPAAPGSTAGASHRAYDGAPLLGVFDSCLPDCDLHLVSSGGEAPVNLTQTGEDQQEGAPSLSPDGSRVAFRCAPPPAEPLPPPATPTPVALARLCIVDVETGTMTPILDDPAIDYGAPAWSPDGQTIAVAFTRLDGTAGISLIEPSGANPRVVLDSPSGVANPAWSPDGTTIVYSCATGSTDGGPDVLQLCSVSPDGTDRRQLPRITGSCGAPEVAPDGFIVAVVCFAADGEGGDLYQVGMGEGQAVPVTDDQLIAPEGQARPSWSTNGTTVFVRRDDALWAIDVVARAWSLTSMPALHGDFTVRTTGG
jgi:Right handed beta helix region/WD40-like Beta Propeller Repeat